MRSIHFHPTGDFILAGTELNIIKIYDVATMKCYTSERPVDTHTGPINQVLIFNLKKYLQLEKKRNLNFFLFF